MAIPSNWVSLENRFYRRQLQYSAGPSLNSIHLASCLHAVSPNAGPVALIPDAGWGITHSLTIHTLSGEKLHHIERLRERIKLTDPPFRAVALGWSVNDLLTIVYNDGLLIRLPGGGDLTRVKSVRVFEHDNVYDAAVLHTGDVIIRTDSGAVYRVDAFEKLLTEPFNVLPPERVAGDIANAGIAAISPEHSNHEVIETILITENRSVVVANSSGIHPVTSTRNVSLVALSSNAKYLVAIESSSGSLFVWDILRQTEIVRLNLVVELSILGVENAISEELFDAKKPDALSWVGSDSIAILYKEHLVLVGPKRGLAVLNLEESEIRTGVILNNEKDGLRLISCERVEFLQMVPELITSIFYQKQAPSYKLFKSSGVVGEVEAISMQALTRYRLLRELREAGTLLEAARSCVNAAYLELDVTIQKQLLRAAAYGQRYATVFADDKDGAMSANSELPILRKRRDARMRRDVDMIPTAIAILRVLNASASDFAGVPLTKLQFDTLGLPGLVARLSRYGKHTIALRLASFGGISPYDVLAEWSKDVIRNCSSEPDEHIKYVIEEKFEAVSKSFITLDRHGSRRSKALPYVVAAEAAFAAKRPKCAELLLRQEMRPAPKVDMFLRMGREKQAVTSAVASGDPELVLDVLGHILEAKNVKETARIIRSLQPSICTRATDLLATHLKQIGSTAGLKLLYWEVGRWREAAMVEIQTANLSPDPRKRMSDLEAAARSIGKGRYRRACRFELQAVQHAAAVASNAIELEKRAKLEPGSLRYANDGELLARTIQNISDSSKKEDMIARLRRELMVPERRFFWVSLTSMAKVGDFKGIDALSNAAGLSKGPPIGFSAFVDICLKHGKEEQAVTYARRIVDLRDRARALARCGQGREAADIASRLGNQQLLEEVQDLTARHVNQLPMPSRREGDEGRRKTQTR